MATEDDAKILEVVDVEILDDDSVRPEIVNLRRGSRIRWTNNTEFAAIVEFGEPSPFEGSGCLFHVPPKGESTSEKISQSAESASLIYRVTLQRPGATQESTRQFESLRSPISNPTVVITIPK